MAQITIQQFLDDYEVPYLLNYEWFKQDENGKTLKDENGNIVKDGFTLNTTYNTSKIQTENNRMRNKFIGEPNWINIYYKYMNDIDIFILDIDDKKMTVEESNNLVKKRFGFLPPYTLSTTKKLPHYLLFIENFPLDKQDYNNTINCFKGCEADLLLHVVEWRKSIVYNLEFEDGNAVFKPLDWNNIKHNFYLKNNRPTTKPKDMNETVEIIKEISEPKEVVFMKKLEEPTQFKDQIELIKASKYYNEVFDLVNIKVVDGEKFRFKATARYSCSICNRDHINNSNMVLVDCSKGGIAIICRPNGKAVFVKERTTKSQKCDIVIQNDDEDIIKNNLIDYKLCKEDFERDNLHFYCSHTKKFYTKEILIDGSINYNPHTAQEFKIANGNIYYDEVVTKMTKDGISKKVEKKSFIGRWITDEDRKQIINFDYNVDPDYKPNKDYINLWTGFDILKTDLEEYSEEQKTKIIEVIDKFFTNLGGSSKNSKDIAEYFKNWVAHIIQKPHIKQITVPFLQSDEQGAGKTTLPIFIGNILGDESCLKYVIISNGFDELNETFNNNLRDCFVFCADELSPTDGSSNYNKFKKETSSPNRKINTKYGDVITIVNKIQMCITSNNASAIPIPKNQRRLVASELTTDLHNQNWFSEYFYPLLKDKKNCRFIYEYFNNLDISNYKPSEIPESDYSKLMSEHQKDIIEKYIDNNYEYINAIETVKGEKLYEHYNNWLEKQHIKTQIPSTIGLYISKNKYAKLIFNKKKSNTGVIYTTNKDEIEKYFNKMCDIDLE